MKQIRLKDSVMKISACGKCPMGRVVSFGTHCYASGKYVEFVDLPEWCPLEDYDGE